MSDRLLLLLLGLRCSPSRAASHLLFKAVQQVQPGWPNMVPELLQQSSSVCSLQCWLQEGHLPWLLPVLLLEVELGLAGWLLQRQRQRLLLLGQQLALL